MTLEERRKEVNRARLLAASAIFAGLIAVGGLIAIPFPLVPFTLQTLFVYLSVLKLKRSSLLSVAIYLTMGLVGLPVFAGGAAGYAELVGPRGGFLVGFLAGSATSGFVISGISGWRHSQICALLVCEAIIMGAGWLWLSYWVGMAGALWLGVVLFIPGDAIKIILALLVNKKVRLSFERVYRSLWFVLSN